MQLMTWTLARLGSRFSLLFEPHHRRVRHSGLGQTLDRPLDLMVGLVEPDGTERVLPFSARGVPLGHTEQFERLNSITFRGYSWHYRLRFELNVHSVFYPQNERLCTIPAFYLEIRISPADHLRGVAPASPVPDQVKLFIRIDRPNTHITASGAGASPGSGGQIDLRYRSEAPAGEPGTLEVCERIVSLNADCQADSDGKGLTLDLPVSEAGSGIKWRLVWGAHCTDPIPVPGSVFGQRPVRLRYQKHWADLDAVMEEAIRLRDDRLAHSRWLERLIDQTPLSMAQRHLLNQSFQAFLDNTVWCDRDDGTQWFDVCENDPACCCSIDVGYHASMVYLALWPQLLARQLDQWAGQESPHEPSGGSTLGRVARDGAEPDGQATVNGSALVSVCQFLIMLQAYAHWTGDLAIVRRHADLIERLASYLVWADRDQNGFPSNGRAGASDGTDQSVHDAGRLTSLAIKRLAALQAAGDLLGRTEHPETALDVQRRVETDARKIESRAWMGDHYTHCIDQAETGVLESWTAPAPGVTPPAECDAYAIDTGNGLLLPVMTAQPALFEIKHLQADLANAARETLAAYGCGDNSSDIEDIWISRNLWRDHLALYLHHGLPVWHERYWDLQVVSNTHEQSLGYCDTYIGHDVTFSPRGAVSFGFLLACPRLVIDRLAPGGARISVQPNRHFAKRWPLLPLADWKAGKIPVCVVDSEGHVTIEGESDPVIIHGDEGPTPETIG